MERSRVVVVDDSRFMRKIITDIIEADPQFTVVATAENGLQAIELVEIEKPDIITLDLEMPEMNGIDALQAILKKHKIPIIMLSGISESNTHDTIRALQYGAFDFIRKPISVGQNANDIVSTGELLIDKMKIAVLTKRSRSFYKPVIDPKIEQEKRTSTVLKPLASLSKSIETVNSTIKQSPKQAASLPNEVTLKPNEKKDNATIKREIDDKLSKRLSLTTDVIKSETSIRNDGREVSEKVTQIVAIGTSTGGPRALHEVISNLPAGFSAPVVVVQHMPPKFTHSLAQRLDHFSDLTVVEAKDQMQLQNGHVYIAPGGYHMKVMRRGSSYIVTLSTEPPRNGHRPSVDILYESLVDFQELERHIVIMTGMGSDGAQGMKALVSKGVSSTIAESEQSCVVYGMPRSAVELGVVEKVLPLTQISPEIVRKVMKRALK